MILVLFLFFNSHKLQRSVDANVAYSGGGLAVGPMVIMDGLTGSALTEDGRRRRRVLLLARLHVIIIIVVGVIFVLFSLNALRYYTSTYVNKHMFAPQPIFFPALPVWFSMQRLIC